MHTTAISDGLVVDNEAPTIGVVYSTLNFDGLARKPFYIDSKWQGFGDVHSHVHHYDIMLQNESGEIEEDFQNVGILTSFRHSTTKLNDGEMYIVSVKATDAAGHESAVTSLPLLYDISPPEGLSCSEYILEEISTLTCASCHNSLSACAEESMHCLIKKKVFFKKHFLHKVVLIADIKNVSEDLVARLNIEQHWEWITLHRISDDSIRHETTYIPSENTTSQINIFVYRGIIQHASVRIERCIKQGSDTSEIVFLKQNGTPRLISVCWNIFDRHGGIKSFKISIGTNAGGFQLMTLTDVGSAMSVTVPIAVHHRTPIFVTLIAEDVVGNRQNFSGNSTILWSGPDIHNLTISYYCVMHSSCSFQVDWFVNVLDDLVSFCSWSIGKKVNI